MKKKFSLTDKHRAQLKPWADKWIGNAMSTEAMTEEDRKICRKATVGLYAAANLPPPKAIVFVPSPFVLRFAGGFAASWWKTRAATDDATDAATYAATRAATDDATRDATDAATYAATRAATDDATRDATDDATDAATRAATDDEQWYVMNGNPAIRRTKSELDLVVSIISGWQGGNQWSAWDSFLSFFRHVANLDLPEYKHWDHWEQLSLHSGPRIVRSEFCMISDRPCVLKVDAQNRPHCDDGPFCAWRDGSALFAVHGVRIPAWIILHPELITADKINKETNAEIRRVMMDKFGKAKYIKESGMTPVHRDDFGTLYKVPVKNDEPLTMVEVVNSTPQPDGSYRNYWMRVAPDLKPMRLNPEAKRFETFGNGQELTARNAVASTFGMRGDDYAPEQET